MATMKIKKIYVIIGSVMAVLLALGLALSICGVVFKTVFNTYLGKGKASIVAVEGSENWDKNYYEPSFSSTAESRANGERLTERLCNEGFVLLKNRNNALPLQANQTRISLLGRGAVDPLYGGSGSGNVDTAKAITPYIGLQQAGFTMDNNSYNYFNGEKGKYERCKIVMDNYNASQWLIGEVAYNDGAGLQKPFTVVDGVAVYVISRAGGEGWDLSNNLKRDAQNSETYKSAVQNGTGKAEYDTYQDGQHQLELSAYEKNWLTFCKNNYQKTVVVINSSNAMELGELQDDNGVDAILWVGGPGSTGFKAMGNILSGKVNPSGKTADIYTRDFTKDPTFVNASVGVQYTDIGKGEVLAGNNQEERAFLTQYEEGIYLGYRYYETRYKDNEAEYQKSVVYPFGFGLSYTTFSKETDWQDDGDTVTAKVTVTNTGEVAGKEVVQLYYTPPYTKDGIAKSEVVLGGFAKTKELKKGESDTVSITVEKEDMASYDYLNKSGLVPSGGYVLERGDYTLSIRENSHTLSEGEDNVYTFRQTASRAYTEDTSFESDDMLITRKAARNRFNDVSAIFTDYQNKKSGYATLMSRDNWAESMPTAPTEADQKAKNIALTYVNNQGQTVTKTVAEGLKPFDEKTELLIPQAQKPKVGAENGLALSMMRGLSYNDPLWEELLDQIKDQEYKDPAALGLGNGAYQTLEIPSVGKPASDDHDGPQGFSVLFGAQPDACAYCSEVVIASTFNGDLAHEMGVAIGEEALALGYNGWYAPAMNIHRTPFAGRNFEYYSEDPLLSGKMGQKVVEGAAKKGCYSFIKHYAVNDTEVYRTTNQCTWVDEQTLREIYLKPFEICVKDAKTTMKYISDVNGTVKTRDIQATTAVMSAFNRIGTTWAGGSYPMQTEVLRDEWGFRGFVLSDFNLYDYMPAEQGLRAGTDIQLSFGRTFKDTQSPTYYQSVRQAIKNMCYTLVNSNVMQGIAPGSIVIYGMAWWQILIIVLDCLFAVAVGAGATYIIYDILQERKRKGNAQ